MSKMLRKYEGYALITGGSSGLGHEYAKQLAKEGYNLILVARDKNKLEKVASSIMKKHPVDVITISEDLADPKSTDKIFDLLKKKKIHVGLLINNAGYGHTEYFHKADRKQLLDMINVMCLGLTDLTYKFLPPMLEQGSGAVILISSIAAMVPGPISAVYSASKAYSLELGISLHAEYGSKGIDFLTVCPAFVDTPFFEKATYIKPRLAMLSGEEVVTKSLNALGKDVYVKILNKDKKQHLLMFLLKFLSPHIIEKLTKQYYKDELNIKL